MKEFILYSSLYNSESLHVHCPLSLPLPDVSLQPCRPQTPVKGGGWTVSKNLVRMTFSVNAFHVAFRAFRCLTISVFFAGVATLGTCRLTVLLRVWVSQGKACSEAEEEE